MRTIRGFIAGLFVAGVLGGSGGATPTVAHVTTKPPTSGVVRGPAQVLHPKVTKPSETTETADDSKDSSTGVTGLANAIAHVSQNLADHPNKGSANALSHLKANQAKHEAKSKTHEGDESHKD